jgi:hypothetical protein
MCLQCRIIIFSFSVYYSNEVLHKFKKYHYDWCVIQSERQDGEKLVLSMESVENDLPIPAGVNRIKVRIFL